MPQKKGKLKEDHDLDLGLDNQKQHDIKLIMTTKETTLNKCNVNYNVVIDVY